MIFLRRKFTSFRLELNRLESFSKLIRDHSPVSANFPESLPHVLKLVGVESGSLYVLDEKNAVFLLKSWVGRKPLCFSLSADHEFLKFVRLREGPVSRDEFTKKSHELRQSALLFFQETVSNKSMPILKGQNWIGFLCLDERSSKLDVSVQDEILGIYGNLVQIWAEHDRISLEYKKLTEFGQVKNELLHNVTHEFQTPLNGILGITDAILDGADGVVQSGLKTHLEMIRDAGRQLHGTLSNIIKITQVESVKNRVKLEKINLLTLTEEVVLLYQTLFEERHNRCILPKKNAEYEVFAEPDQIRTVLMNLVGNAVKFTQNGEVTIEMYRNGAMLHVSISDTGDGIETEKLDFIFAEFYQADATHTRAHGGTGLGLALVKKIVTLHGGRVWAESQKGVGTKVNFTLPVFPG